MSTRLSGGGAGWPTGTDYAQAIQHAESAFADVRLRNGTVAKSTLGVPLVASGQNAVVFLMRLDATEQAVRCFTTPPVDGSSRYDALSAHLTMSPPTAITASRWIDEGIHVGVRQWPIVVMPWIEGRPFNLVVEDLVGDGDAILRLADAWIAMVVQLQAADVTHGDLQHGNVLVRANGELCLVDLDGAWVPSMRVGAPGELGHPNYQHPRRSAAQWARYGDSFSALVVETGLRGLAADPSLERFLTGENVLFGRRDLLDLDTELWRALLRSSDPEVVRLASILRDRTGNHPDTSMTPFAELRDGGTAAPSLPTFRSPDAASAAAPPSSTAASTATSGAWWSEPASATSSHLPPPPAGPAPATVIAGLSDAMPAPPPGPAPTTPSSTGHRVGVGAKLGRDATVSGAFGGGVAALVGSLLGGLISKAVSDQAVPVVYVTTVAVMLGAFLVSWQALTAGAYAAAARRAGLGALIGAGAGLLALVPANAVYSSADRQIGSKVFDGHSHGVFDIGAPLSGVAWMCIALLVGLGVGAIGGWRSALAAATGGAVAGFLGGCLFGSQVAEFRGHLLLVDGLDPPTAGIVTIIGVVIGLAIGITTRTVSRARLVVIEGRQHGMQTLLPARRGSIGSAARNTLVLVGDPTVAPRHVEITLSANEQVATVPGNGSIRVNGVETRRVALKDGDVMSIGASFVRFEWKGPGGS